MNTARAFGPAAVTGFKYGTHWVVRTLHFRASPSPHASVFFQYWVGPCLGSFLGAGLYTIMKQYVIKSA
jgi:aquaporin related protein